MNEQIRDKKSKIEIYNKSKKMKIIEVQSDKLMSAVKPKHDPKKTVKISFNPPTAHPAKALKTKTTAAKDAKF